MLRRFRIATLSAVMTVAACKTDKPAPPILNQAAAPAAKPASAASLAPAAPATKPASHAPAAHAELQTKAVAMMQRMVDMFDVDGKDCEKLAADLRSFATDNQDLLSQLEAMQRQASEDEREAFLIRMQAVQAAVSTKMQGAMAACAANPSVRAAMKQFPAERD